MHPPLYDRSQGLFGGRVSEVAGGILERCPLPRDMYGSRRVFLDSDTMSGHVEKFVVLEEPLGGPCVLGISNPSSAGRFSRHAVFRHRDAESEVWACTVSQATFRFNSRYRELR